MNPAASSRRSCPSAEYLLTVPISFPTRSETEAMQNGAEAFLSVSHWKPVVGGCGPRRGGLPPQSGARGFCRWQPAVGHAL